MRLNVVNDAVFAPLTLVGRRSETVDALVDTGADVTGIPMSKCIGLGFKVEGFRLFRGLFGSGFLPTSEATVVLGGIHSPLPNLLEIPPPY